MFPVPVLLPSWLCKQRSQCEERLFSTSWQRDGATEKQAWSWPWHVRVAFNARHVLRLIGKISEEALLIVMVVKQGVVSWLC